MDHNYRRAQKIRVQISEITDLGLRVRFEDGNQGLIYHSDTKQRKAYRIGDRLDAYIKNIRDDGKLDLTLNKIGYQNFIDPVSSKIMEKLKQAGGSLPYHDKSKPKEIKNAFGFSKNKFKQAIGKLYKQKKIRIHDRGIELV